MLHVIRHSRFYRFSKKELLDEKVDRRLFLFKTNKELTRTRPLTRTAKKIAVRGEAISANPPKRNIVTACTKLDMKEIIDFMVARCAAENSFCKRVAPLVCPAP